ncbi:hypothetical protein MKX07_006214, partial [Trichoderma sp. CBMAI-0711]
LDREASQFRFPLMTTSPHDVKTTTTNHERPDRGPSDSRSSFTFESDLKFPEAAEPNRNKLYRIVIMIFIITILLLAADFYYLKNIAGRRLVGLRWWNEVDPQTGESQWVFESLEPGTRQINATDSRFFWLALYIQPLWWVLMAVLALIRLQFLWLPLVAIALALTIINTLAFSRCDKFSQASNFAGGAFGSTNLAGSIASNFVSRMFRV